MGTDIEGLENQKASLRQKLYEAKDRRESLNRTTNELKNVKNNLLDQINEHRKQALMHKEQRDEINQNVAIAKKRRSELNEEYDQVKKVLEEQRKQYFPTGPSLEQLKKQRDELEFKQMTHQLRKRDEEDLIDQLAQLNRQIKQREAVLEENEELNELVQKAADLKLKGDKEHQRVRELAEKAQQHHTAMLDYFAKANEVRKELKRVERDYIINRLNADKAHREFIEYIKAIREIEETVNNLRDQVKRVEIKKEKDDLTKKADDIYEKFKRGEKLSTEDLLLLQKAGLI
jgi:uncharacterized coiled-coil DUF342 family protein